MSLDELISKLVNIRERKPESASSPIQIETNRCLEGWLTDIDRVKWVEEGHITVIE